MKVTEKGHTITVKDTQGDPESFLKKISDGHNAFKNHNLILDLSHDKDITLKFIQSFNKLSKAHRSGKKSFVIVASGIDFNALPRTLIVVPSVLEAQDIIEMEEIERDLGF